MEIAITSILTLFVGLVVGRLFFNPKNMIKENEKLQQKHNDLQDENIRLREEVARLEVRNKLLESRKSEIKKDFELYAQELLKRMGSDFNETQNQNMGNIVSPLKVELNSFKEEIEKRNQEISKQAKDLEIELKTQRELNQKIHSDAKDLTEALKGDSKKIGNWGEMTLRKILELSGLTKGEGFIEQEKQESAAEGKRQYVDFRINLQDNKHLIVDSKVSFVAYKKFVNAESEEDKSNFLKEHVKSVRERIKELSGKDYHASDAVNSPDFVFLFMSPEPALIEAMKKDPSLYQYAWEKNIVLMSPSLLMAALKSVNSMWVRERGRRNDKEIARQAGNLYDKFVAFLDSLKGIGISIEKAQKSYDDAEKRLSVGNDSLISRVKKIKELGVSTKKEIGPKWDAEDVLDEPLNEGGKKELTQGNGDEKFLDGSPDNKKHETLLPKDKNKISKLTRIHSE